MPTARSGQDWVELTKARFIRNVQRNKASTIRELEARISESGPTHMRPEPVIITTAKNILVRESIYPIEEKTYSSPNIEVKTYGHTSHDANELREAHRYKGELHEKYMNYALNQTKGPGKVGERIVDKTIIVADTMQWDGIPGNVEELHEKRIPHHKTIDFGLTHKLTGIPLGVEVKNSRKWVYADSDTIWELLGKCAYLEALPVIIARQFSYTAMRNFRKIGILGLSTYKQFFHPDYENDPDLLQVKSKDGLCFKDITFTTDPNPRMVKFFSTTIPNNITKYFETFTGNLPLIKKYALESDMWNPNMHSSRRQALYKLFIDELYEDEEQEPPL